MSRTRYGLTVLAIALATAPSFAFAETPPSPPPVSLSEAEIQAVCAECERLAPPNHEMITAGNVLLGVSLTGSLLSIALSAVHSASSFAPDDPTEDALIGGAIGGLGVGVVSAAIGIPLVVVGARRVPIAGPEASESAAEPQVVVRVKQDAAVTQRVDVGVSVPF